jgi:hypothetical protein
MTNLLRRLAALEARVHQRLEEPLGSYEVHFTEACRPDRDFPDAEVHPCVEPDHPQDCRVQRIPIAAPIRRILILQAPWMPLS